MMSTGNPIHKTAADSVKAVWWLPAGQSMVGSSCGKGMFQAFSERMNEWQLRWWAQRRWTYMCNRSAADEEWVEWGQYNEEQDKAKL